MKSNKQNSFLQNQVSTGIGDSIIKSSYSSKFLQTQKRNINTKKLVPSKYQKYAKVIQRFWRFRQLIKRKVNQQLSQNLTAFNNCIELENNILQKLIEQHQKQINFQQQFNQFKVRQSYNEIQQQISSVKKQCVLVSFSLNKNNPKQQFVEQIINKKQQQKQLNIKLNHLKIDIQQKLQKQKLQNQSLLNQISLLNTLHLELVKEKNKITQKKSQILLEKCKKEGKNNSLYIKDCSNKQNQYKNY